MIKVGYQLKESGTSLGLLPCHGLNKMLSFVLLTITPKYSCGMLRVVLSSTLAFAALVAVVIRYTFCGAGLIFLCSCLRFRVWV